MPFAAFGEVFNAAIAKFADGKFHAENVAVLGHSAWAYTCAENKAAFAERFFQELQQTLELYFKCPYLLKPEEWKAFEEKWTAPVLATYAENGRSLEVMDAVYKLLC